ncbi:TetR/AcrR family transcriptional regulator [Desulfatibacillum aliphaticivorans]|uniref:TetR/AcrR family transcriptional regulator n=1 Tax=Desulfatibacillum aliphaticivorans TaxID=218208 RepID=UPI0003F672D6|nr:TetR/AcrR family transcriptional regulator [Desulfatibacillum aliphaticivorans]
MTPSGRKKTGPAKPSKRQQKTEATRKRITDAARQVFTNYPYDAASIRMIGQEGGFNHSFVRYHFKSKAKLFESVAKSLIGEYYQASGEMVMELNGPLYENTKVLAERFVGYAFDNPDAFYIMMLNMGAVDNVKDAFPGMEHLRGFHEDTLALFAASGYFKADIKDISQVFFCSSILLANCVGAANFYGKVLGINPNDPEYREWVKDLFVFVLYPSVKRLFFAKSRKSGPDPLGAGKGALLHSASAVRKRIKGAAKNVMSLGPTSPAFKKLLADIEKSALRIRKGRITTRVRRGETKGQATRRRIIAVARRVFSKYPYNAASIRMIGEEGGFDFTLLYHYFPKKAELFEAVTSQLLGEFRTAVTEIIKELDSPSMRENMTRFVDKTLDYSFENPDVMMGCMQNIAQLDKFEDMPGFEHLTRFLIESLELFKEYMPLPESDERVRMWLYGFGTVVFSCVGAASYHAQVLGMEPKGPEYRQWVKDTLMNVFYPCMKSLLFSNK